MGDDTNVSAASEPPPARKRFFGESAFARDFVEQFVYKGASAG